MAFETTAVLKQIRETLSQEPNPDLGYLVEMLRKYQNYPDSAEICKGINEMILEIIPIQFLDQDNRFMYHFLDTYSAALDSIADKDFPQAECLLKEVLDSVDGIFEDDARSTYKDFSSHMERQLYDLYGGNRKTVRPPGGLPMSRIWYSYGFILGKNNKNEEAKTAYDRSLDFNPASAKTYFALADTYLEEDLEMFNAVNETAYPYIYTSRDLSHYFRNRSYYYTTKEEWMNAMTCLLNAETYDFDHPVNSQMMNHLLKKSSSKGFLFTNELMHQEEKITKISPFAAKKTMDLAWEQGNLCLKNGNLAKAGDFIGIYYDLMGGDEAAQLIEELSTQSIKA